MKFEKQNLFFTSDFHIGHANVIKFDGRPFSDLNEMHERLIQNWNSVVSDDDIVFYLGDLSHRCHPETVKWFVNQLKGKIHFIMGNHDRYRDISRLNRFERIYGDDTTLGGATINVKDSDVNRGYQSIVMCHYSVLSWNKAHYGAWQIHGHSHQSLTKNPEMEWFYKRKVIDAGCNGWDYTPISYTQLKDVMKTRIIKPVDHHEGD
jgi:calcineurin-like phosphoesterase family protein